MTAPTFTFTRMRDPNTGVEFAKLDYLSDIIRELDPVTGLPRVPEGCEWVIEQRKYGGDQYYIVLRKTVVRSYWWGLTTTKVKDLNYTLFPASMDRFSDDLVLSEALYVLRDYEKDGEKLSNRNYNEKYLGSYPPKKLEGN